MIRYKFRHSHSACDHSPGGSTSELDRPLQFFHCANNLRYEKTRFFCFYCHIANMTEFCSALGCTYLLSSSIWQLLICKNSHRIIYCWSERTNRDVIFQIRLLYGWYGQSEFPSKIWTIRIVALQLSIFHHVRL